MRPIQHRRQHTRILKEKIIQLTQVQRPTLYTSIPSTCILSSSLPTHGQRHNAAKGTKDGALDHKQPKPNITSRTVTGSDSITGNSSQLKSFLRFTETPTSRPNARTQEPPPWNFWLWFDKYLSAIFGIAVLGGQVTFTLIVSDLVDPATLSADSGWVTILSKEGVRLVIATGWLFFTSRWVWWSS